MTETDEFIKMLNDSTYGVQEFRKRIRKAIDNETAIEKLDAWRSVVRNKQSEISDSSFGPLEELEDIRARISLRISSILREQRFSSK
jgi:hypothetical protein